MSYPVTQRTIAKPVRMSGFGFFGGRDVTVEFRPACANTGIVFVRRDYVGGPRIQASVSNRLDSPRRTVLVENDVRVEMVEHVLSALAGLGIDNCLIATNQPEMPGCDGSAEPFVDVLLMAGLVDLDAPRRQLVVNETVRVGDEESWLEAAFTLGGGLSLEYTLAYGPGPIGLQEFRLAIDSDSFRHELAPARTFLLLQEAEALASQNIGQRVTARDLLIFDSEGPMENELRFGNECVRHKMLDMLGDFTLSGCDIIGHVVGYRSGHRLNAELVKALLETHDVTERRESHQLVANR